VIGALKGQLLAHSAEALIVDVAGVGYEVSVSAEVSANYEIGSEVQLFIYTDVRENAITLFGFENQQEKEVFLLLRKVKGVGSKLAISIVSNLGAIGVLSAIGNGDSSALQKVPGVGKKTAERILVELREQVVSLAVNQKLSIEASSYRNTESHTDGGLDFQAGSRVEADVMQALTKLGFSTDKAKSAVSESLTVLTQGSANVLPDDLDSGEVLRVALANL